MGKNPLDAFAGGKKPAKKTSAKVAATGLTDELKQAVDIVISSKANLKKIKSELAIAETALIEHVYPQQEAAARKGNYCKSFTVAGTDGTIVTITTGDKFTVAKESDAQDELKKLLAKQFDNFMRMKRTVKLTESAQENKKLIDGFIAVATKLGLTVPEVFEIVDELSTLKDMDEKQFALAPAKLAVFRTIVKQYKATVK